MNDPAMNAAQRVWDARYAPGPSSWDLSKSVRQDGIGAFILAAAREALAPLREIHFSVEGEGQYPVCATCCTTEGGLLVAGNPIEWPCATARLVYSSEELS